MSDPTACILWDNVQSEEHRIATQYAIAALDEADELREEVARLRGLISTPHTDDFLEAVRIEAAYQRERWGEEHDAHKTPGDWLWTLGYLVNKAVHDIRGKRLHHIVAGGALLLNWHRIERERATPAEAYGEHEFQGEGFDCEVCGEGALHYLHQDEEE